MSTVVNQSSILRAMLLDTRFVVLEAMEPDNEPDKSYQIWAGWKDMDSAASWVRSLRILGALVKPLQPLEQYLGQDKLPPAAIPTWPHAIVLDDKLGLEPIGFFASAEYAVRVCQEIFLNARAKRLYRGPYRVQHYLERHPTERKADVSIDTLRLAPCSRQ